MDCCSCCGNNDIPADSAICNKCKYRCCESCLTDKGLCQDCFDNLCPMCYKNEITGDSNNEKYCEKCDRRCCLECISLTGCQTVLGTCKECFDHLCWICKKKNLPNGLYLDDYTEHYPICKECFTNLCTICYENKLDDNKKYCRGCHRICCKECISLDICKQCVDY